MIPRLERDAQRDLVEVLARQADLLRDDDEYLDTLAATLVEPGMPLDAARLTAAPIALARRAVRLWLGAPPPSLDQVDAVLDVARGGVRAVQLPGGERIERAAGRLHRIGDDGRSARAGTLVAPGTRACSGNLRSMPGSSPGRPPRGPTSSTLQCSMRTGRARGQRPCTAVG